MRRHSRPRNALATWLALPLLAITVPTPAAASEASDITAAAAELHALQRLDQRVADIGWRLLASAGELCPRRQAGIGINLHSLAQYEPQLRSAAQQAFGLDPTQPSILSVAAGSPAARAGLRVNDVLLMLNGRPLGGQPQARVRQPRRSSYAAIEQAMAALEDLTVDAPAVLTVRRGATPVTVSVLPVLVCRSRIELVPGGAVNGSANGTAAQIYGGLVAWSRNDDELALAIAHEVAHNVLAHQARIEREKLRPGLFGGFGRKGRKLREMERDADHLGTLLAARAGFDYRLAPTFFAAVTARSGLAALWPGIHPAPADRKRSLEQVVAEIAAGQKPDPAAASGEAAPGH